MIKYDLCVIVPSLGNKENISKLFRSIETQKLENFSIQILLILNGIENEKTEDYRNEFSYLKNLTLLYSDKKNASIARNIGMRSSSSNLLYFLDDDCELINNRILLNYINLANQNKEVFAFGGGYRCDNNVSFFDRLYNHIQMKWYLDGKISVDGNAKYLLGGNFLINKIHLTNEINFSEFIDYGGSENYFFSKAFASQKIIKHVPLDVVHHTRETFFSILFKTFKQGKGQAIIEFQNKKQSKTVKNSGSDIVKITSDEKVIGFSQYLFNFFVVIYRYSFWFGYYHYQKRYFKFIFTIIFNLISFLNGIRYKIIDKIKSD